MQNTLKVVSRTDTHPLSELERAVALEVEAKDELLRLLEWNREEAQTLDLHEVERGLLKGLLALGNTLLRSHLARRGTGKAGGEVLRDGAPLPYHSFKSRAYLSIFGLLQIRRAYFWKEGQPGVSPLDVELNLPETRYSYLLQELGELIGVSQAYDRVTDYLARLLGVSFWKQGVQKVARQAGKNVQAYYEQKAAPPAGEEGELLVAAIDGKGVPMRRQAPPKRLRPEKGPRPNKKKEAIVSAVYTIDRNTRTADAILREIDKEGHVVPPAEAPPERPKPQHKRVRATMLGKNAAFEEIRRQFEERDPDGTKERVALTDGDPALQVRALGLAGSSKITLVLDLLHVLTYLWAAAYAFHEEGSVEASRWVMDKLRLLLEGKVGYVIGGLRQSITKRKLRRPEREPVQQAIAYMENNREFMRYDEYLAKGYPIGSGVVEGACRHLVKDRLELAGMHWSKPGAQAVLELRAVETNGDWDGFWRFHVREEDARLYGTITRRDSRGFEYFPGRPGRRDAA
jgi:hypothetical protein